MGMMPELHRLCCIAWQIYHMDSRAGTEMLELIDKVHLEIKHLQDNLSAAAAECVAWRDGSVETWDRRGLRHLTDELGGPDAWVIEIDECDKKENENG